MAQVNERTSFSFSVMVILIAGAVSFGMLQWQVMANAQGLTKMDEERVSRREFVLLIEQLDRLEHKLDRVLEGRD